METAVAKPNHLMQRPRVGGFGFAASLHEFMLLPPNAVVGEIVQRHIRQLDQAQENRQVRAWADEVELLRCITAELIVQVPTSAQWHLVLEFEVPRRGSRIDAVVLADGIIIPIEFKVGETRGAADAVRQVEDYALELRDFHEGSRGRTIFPVLCPTEFKGTEVRGAHDEYVAPTTIVGGDGLAEALAHIYSTRRDCTALDPERWLASQYRPTPTIIEAAQALYAGHSVREIARSEAAAENLADTQEAIARAVALASDKRCKIACFVTGVPGAGKTLAGLSFVNGVQSGQAVFLSGNGPLVKVLQEALARNSAVRLGASLKGERHRSRTFVANVHRWLDEYIDRNRDAVPVEPIVCFDEAQRAWDRAQSKRKFGRDASEPEMLLRALDRRTDWSVLIALIGNGQEINRGEAGISEWGRALESEFSHWHVLLPPRLAMDQHLGEFEATSLISRCTGFSGSGATPQCSNAIVPSRASDTVGGCGSPRSAGGGCPAIEGAQGVPSCRDTQSRRCSSMVRVRTRGLRRSGLVASSGGRRLRAGGIEVTLAVGVEDWFLADESDVRSSGFLEIAATEFAIQGLELDWVGVCWDADLRWNSIRQGFEPGTLSKERRGNG